MKCAATTKLGQQCRANAVRGERRCILHSSPDRARVLGSAGGRRRTVLHADLRKFDPPRDALSLKRIIAHTIIELRNIGHLDARVANAIAVLAGAFLKADEISDLQARVRALEGRERRTKK